MADENVNVGMDEDRMWEEAVNAAYASPVEKPSQNQPGVPAGKTAESVPAESKTETQDTKPDENAGGSENSGSSEAAEETAEDMDGDNEEWLKKINEVNVHVDGEEQKKDEKAEPKQEPDPEKKAESVPLDADTKEFLKTMQDELKNDTDLKQSFEDYPEDMGTFMKIAAKMIEKVIPHIEEKVAGRFEGDLKNIREYKASSEAEMERQKKSAWDAEIEKSVPGWNEIIHKDKAFPAWFEKQPPVIKACLQEARDPEDVVFALNKFKSDKASISKTNKEQRSIYSNPMNDNGRQKSLFRNEGDQDVSEWDEAVKYAMSHR